MNGSRNPVTRLLHAISIGRITVVDDSGPVQKLQVSERPGPDGSPGVTDNVLRVPEFGFTSRPPAKSEVVLIRLWGNRTLTLAIGTNNQPKRLKNLSEGDAALYDQRGAYVWLTPQGLVIDGAGLPARIRNVGRLTVEDNVDVGQNLAVNTGASGSFTTPTGLTVTVQDGVITNIY